MTDDSLSDRHLTYTAIGQSDIKKHQVCMLVPASDLEGWSLIIKRAYLQENTTGSG